jgi:hypothetical protein
LSDTAPYKAGSATPFVGKDECWKSGEEDKKSGDAGSEKGGCAGGETGGLEEEWCVLCVY